MFTKQQKIDYLKLQMVIAFDFGEKELGIACKNAIQELERQIPSATEDKELADTPTHKTLKLSGNMKVVRADDDICTNCQQNPCECA